MSAEDQFEVPDECQATGQRWLVPMDFSIQANAALSWVFNVMKPTDCLLILNILNLKTPTYAHDIAANERLQRESKEKGEAMKEKASSLGFKFVNFVCKRGEPTKLICQSAIAEHIDCIVMGRRGMSNIERMLNGSVSSYVLSNAPCAVCLMGKGVEERIKREELIEKDKIISELSASASEGEADSEKKVPFFLPRKHSIKNYYSDSD